MAGGVPGETLRQRAISTNPSIQNKVFEVFKFETPFLTKINKFRVKNPVHQWDHDDEQALATDESDYASAGELFDADTLEYPERLRNSTMIIRLDIAIDGRAEVADVPGNMGVKKRQITKGYRYLKRAWERALLRRVTYRVEPGTLNANPATPGNKSRTAGAPAWLVSNVDGGSGYAAPTTSDGAPNAAGTVGAARGFKLSQAKKIILSCFENSGEIPDLVLMPPSVKMSFSEFMIRNDAANVAAPRQNIPKNAGGGKGASLVTSVSMILTDFGTITFMADRYSPASTSASEVLFLNTKYWATFYYRSMQKAEMGTRGDLSECILLVDAGLQCGHEKASGVACAINKDTAVAA